MSSPTTSASNVYSLIANPRSVLGYPKTLSSLMCQLPDAISLS